MVKIMYKYNLNDVEWGEFKVGGKDGIFKVSNSKSYHKTNLTVSSNGIPYVTRTSINNGLQDLIVDENYEKNPKNTISLGAENADFFFQGIDYVSGNKMYSIGNNKITREIGLFLVQVFRQSIKECGFGYGKGLTGTRFKNRYIMLPIDENSNPNWLFMEEYIKERENKQRQELKDYYKNRLLDLVIRPEVLTDVEWRAFKVGNIFNKLRRGKTTPRQTEFGKTKYSYIGAKYNDNGVVDFVDIGTKFKGNAICFVMTGEGSVGKSFYKQEDFVPSNNIYVGYFDKLNRYNGLFVVSAINKQSERYNYGYIRNENRLKNEVIILPEDKNGNPNWHFMENFIKNIEQKQIKNILKYLDQYI
ncbi:restriction endonuclease subunit S [Campylobacter sp. faydin G-105]|uniref:restriction endonuclease subunit S n=1 Tax=Campylobacter anatolicus TaxID=2829105 RepID=UPI001B9ADF00|nr:restriction endonuclease subunit S [Campylobacter anatolicus]MBR8462468.1 restriction endonuclease subunit S [Campylobacter anatolicus]